MSQASEIVAALILLPMFYNPDEQGKRKRVEDEKFLLTAEEIALAFEEGGALWVFRRDQPRGFWWNEGVLNEDTHRAVLEVHIPDTQANRAKLESYAETVLKKRFRQKAIAIVYVAVQRRLV